MVLSCASIGLLLVNSMIKNLCSWSAKNNLFFPNDNLVEYERSGVDLSDIKDIDDAIYFEFSGPAPDGMIRGVDKETLMPCWIEVPPLTKEELIIAADVEKERLLNYAKQHISLWQTQLQLGMISDADKAKLIEWMHYITALQAVDTSTAPDINWPQQPAE